MNTSKFQKILEVHNHNNSGLSFNDVERYSGIDYSSILLSHVIFPQYQMIDYSSNRNTDLSIRAKGYQFVRDPIFVLIDGHRIRYMIHVYQNNITSGIENLTNFIDEDDTPTRSNKLLLSWIQNLPSNGLYIFEIILNNNLINIIDCYLFSNVFLGHQTYEWRLTILNSKLIYHTNVIASKPYPDIDLEEKVLIAKKNNVIIRALQCNASQRFDYILGGNRYNIAPYKFAIIGCHIDKFNKCRYVVLGRHCGTLQVCSLIKLSSAKATTINELTVIEKKTINHNKFSRFCWYCRYPIEGSINYYRTPVIVLCNIRRTGYISIMSIPNHRLQLSMNIKFYENMTNQNSSDRRTILEDFIGMKLKYLKESYTLWLFQNIDGYPAIFKFGILSSQLSPKSSRRNFNDYERESVNFTHKKKSIPDKAPTLDVLMIHDFLEEQSAL